MTSVHVAPVDLDAVREVIDAAAEIVRAGFAAADDVTLKADGSPLTITDTATDGFLRRELGRLLPGAGWLSEETADTDERLSREWTWVVDPLDGTKEFTSGIPEFGISVALIRAGTPVFGSVVNPATGEGGAGEPGGSVEFWGCTPPKEPPACLAEATAIVSRTEIEDRSAAPYLDLARTRAVGGVAYKLLRVAAGLDDVTFSVQAKSEWDVCGGAALLAAAGKVYRRVDGEQLRFNQPDTRIRSGTAAGPPALVEELLRSLPPTLGADGA